MESHIHILFMLIIMAILFILFRYFSNDYIQYKKQNPYLIKGIVTSIRTKRIPSYRITKSIDRRNGIEFTYVFWMKINNIPQNPLETIFYKGDTNGQFKSRCPGVYISTNNYNNTYQSDDSSRKKDMRTIDMIIKLDTFVAKNDCDNNRITNKLNKLTTNDEKNELCRRNNCEYDGEKCKPFECNKLQNINEVKENKPFCNDINYCTVKKVKHNGDYIESCDYKREEVCIIKNLPYNKWFHTTIILMNHYLDVYINGNLYERFEIKGVPKQNDDDLIIGGDDNNEEPTANAALGNLQYFNRAIPYYKIHKMMERNSIDNSKTISEDEDEPPYLGDKYWIGEDTLYKYDTNY